MIIVLAVIVVLILAQAGAKAAGSLAALPATPHSNMLPRTSTRSNNPFIVPVNQTAQGGTVTVATEETAVIPIPIAPISGTATEATVE